MVKKIKANQPRREMLKMFAEHTLNRSLDPKGFLRLCHKFKFVQFDLGPVGSRKQDTNTREVFNVLCQEWRKTENVVNELLIILSDTCTGGSCVSRSRSTTTTQTHRQTDRQTETERERDRETECFTCVLLFGASVLEKKVARGHLPSCKCVSIHTQMLESRMETRVCAPTYSNTQASVYRTVFFFSSVCWPTSKSQSRLGWCTAKSSPNLPQ